MNKMIEIYNHLEGIIDLFSKCQRDNIIPWGHCDHVLRKCECLATQYILDNNLEEAIKHIHFYWSCFHVDFEKDIKDSDRTAITKALNLDFTINDIKKAIFGAIKISHDNFTLPDILKNSDQINRFIFIDKDMTLIEKTDSSENTNH